MKWDNIKIQVELMEQLVALYAKYRRMSFDGTRAVPHYQDVKKEDLDSAGNLLRSLDADSIVEELEGYMCYDGKQNLMVFNIWKKKMVKVFCWQNVFSGIEYLSFDMAFFIWKRQTGESWTSEEFCRYLATFTKKYFLGLQSRIDNLKETYGIVSSFTQSLTSKRATSAFSDIIQYEDKDKLLRRFHELIDGKKGADVGCVILQAYLLQWLTRKPTKGEFESEFQTKGCWTAIYKYFDEDNTNAIVRASKIVFFDAQAEQPYVKPITKYR